MPLTLRLAYHSVRAALRAGLLMFAAWLVFIPANANEQDALGASPGETYPYGLRPMRTARVILAVAPERAYKVIAMVAGPDMSPILVRLMLIQMASGNVLPETASTNVEPENGRDIKGPRFIQVD